MHHRIPEGRFRLLTGADALKAYQSSKKVASHFFCGNCGIHAYSHPRTAPDLFNVNVRCLDDFDLRSDAFELTTFDRQNWKEAFEAMQTKRR